MDLSKKSLFSQWIEALDSNAFRVAQSMTMVAHMPMVLFANAICAVIAAFMLSDAQSVARRVFFVATVWFALLPMLTSWWRLRNRNAPLTVSRRRIVSLVRYSGGLGTIWGILIIIFLRGEPQAIVTYIVAGMGFLCVGGTGILASLPLVCLAYSIPLLSAVLFIILTTPFPSFGLILMLALMAMTLSWLVTKSWAPFSRLLDLTNQNAALLDASQHEVQRQKLLIEQREQSQFALAQSEQRFRNLAALSSDWHWVQDAEFRFTDSLALQDKNAIGTGWGSIGKTQWDMASQDQPSQWNEHRADLGAHRAFIDLEYQVATPGGVQRWVSTSGEPRFNAKGVFLGYHGTGKDITVRKNSETALRESEERLHLAMSATHQAMFDLDIRTGKAIVNDQYATMLGYEPKTFCETAKWCRRRIHPEDIDHVIRIYRKLVEGKILDCRVEYRDLTSTGEWIWILSVAAIVERDQQDKALRLIGTRLDISQRKYAEAAMLASEHRYQLLFENTLDGVLQMTGQGKIVAANPAACRLFRLAEIAICERSLEDLFDPTDSRQVSLFQTLFISNCIREEIQMKRGDATTFHAEVTSSTYADRIGNPLTSMVIRDMTERKEADAVIRQLAYFDPLTNLPNRRCLMDRLDEYHRLARAAGLVGAVYFIDLDNFKNINDARGHAVGDQLLVAIAQRLAAMMRTEDMVARIGGDEFVVLSINLAAEQGVAGQIAAVVAEKICFALMQPVVIDGHPYTCGASIGVTLFPKPEETVGDLLREADTAMYQAKAFGRNRVVFFAASMQAAVEERLALEVDLSHALTRGQISVHVQPQFDVHERIVGAELLLRWTHPVRGAVSPAVFIPVAEESGIILELGDWVLQQACLISLQMDVIGADVPLSVNVSPKQFRQLDFVDRVREILAGNLVSPTKLIFEVTEGLLIRDLETTIFRMKELTSIGVRFSIDDFGTGYSSLAYLRRLPLYELKIDKSFVHDLPHNPDGAAIVLAMISMAKHLRLRIVAEGVETHAQADFLKTALCDCIQGYLFSRPMPVGEWLPYVQSRNRHILAALDSI